MSGWDDLTVGDWRRLSERLLASVTEFVLTDTDPNPDRFEERRRNGELRWLRTDGSRPA